MLLIGKSVEFFFKSEVYGVTQLGIYLNVAVTNPEIFLGFSNFLVTLKLIVQYRKYILITSG